MSTVKIGNAVSDERGKASGGKQGDQTGKEIRIQDWYVSGTGWSDLLVCQDEIMALKAAEIMEQICNNKNYGYNQDKRWDGYYSILKKGIAAGKGDFDCSSLCLACYILAGLKIKPEGYTGNMKKILLDTGKFKVFTANKYLKTSAYAKRGALYLREGHHVAMALDNGSEYNKPVEVKATYYPKYTGKTVSIVDALNSIGVNSALTFRKNIAAANGIAGYKGTEAQNLKMLSLLKQGKLIKP